MPPPPRAALATLAALVALLAAPSPPVLAQAPPPAATTDADAGDAVNGATPGDATLPDTSDLPNEVRQEEAAEALDEDAAISARTEARLRSVFSQIEALSEIEISVASRVATLTGPVDDAETEKRAVELARSFEYVIAVENKLQRSASVGDRVSPTIDRFDTLKDELIAMLPVLGIAAAIVFAAGFLAWLIGRWASIARVFRVAPLVGGLIQRILRLVVIGLGVMLALELLDATALVSAVLGAAGVIGLAVGFALQDIIENYIAGALLSLRQPFNLNDAVEVDDLEGKVVRLTSRETILMSYDGNHVRIPNATVFKSVITNFSRNPRRRIAAEVGIGADQSIVQAQRLGVATLRSMRGVLDDPPPNAFVRSLADWSVVLVFYAWIDQRQADFFKAESEAKRLLKRAFDDAQIDMPEPTYRLLRRDWQPASPTLSADDDPPVAHEAARVDIDPHDPIDAQVAEDQARSDEKNLLDEPETARKIDPADAA